MIEGCGRTFQIKDDKQYSHPFLCGHHYRMAPKRLRDLRTFIRKRARLRGCSDKLARQDWNAWKMIERAILRRGDVGGEGHIDIAEIEAMFGL